MALEVLGSIEFCSLKCQHGLVRELAFDFATAQRLWGGSEWADYSRGLRLFADSQEVTRQIACEEMVEEDDE